MSGEMNRRGFIKGAGVFAAAACGGAANGGTSNVSRSPSAPCQDVDVLVVGGGPAGVCAAIAAARNGAKTLVVERGNCLGGMATRGLVGPFMTCYDKYVDIKPLLRAISELRPRSNAPYHVLGRAYPPSAASAVGGPTRGAYP